MRAKTTKENIFLGKFYVRSAHGKVRLAGVYLSPSQSENNVTVLGYGNGASFVSEWYGLKEVIKLKFVDSYRYHWPPETFEFITL